MLGGGPLCQMIFAVMVLSPKLRAPVALFCMTRAHSCLLLQVLQRGPGRVLSLLGKCLGQTSGEVGICSLGGGAN